MGADIKKHYKFINSRTSNVIYYYSLNSDLSPTEIKAELEKIIAQVAVKNAVPVHTIYWEEIINEAK